MFITFEGIEGVGKTTHLKYMAQWLKKAGISVVTTREPGGTDIGEEIRDILLKNRKDPVSSMTELLLMFAARAQHVEKVIQPALKKGYWVLCDRFLDATYAYQGGGRGIPVDDIATLETLVLGNFRPDYTLLLDAPVEVGLQRMIKRGAQDRFEKEKIDFFERVRAAYGLRAQMNLKRYKIIDASKSLVEIEKQVETITEEILWKHS